MSSSTSSLQMRVLAITGIQSQEWKLIRTVLQQDAAQKGWTLVQADKSTFQKYRSMTPIKDAKTGTEYHGNIGRFVILQTPKLNGQVKDWVRSVDKKLRHMLSTDSDEENGICKQHDYFQPVYIVPQTSDKVARQDVMSYVIREGKERGLFTGVFTPPTNMKKLEQKGCFLPSHVTHVNQNIRDEKADPMTLLVESSIQQKRGVGVLPFPDWGVVAVLDDLVSERLRADLLRVVLGENHEKWDDDNKGPDPKRWTRNGVVDYPGISNDNWGMAGMDLFNIAYQPQPAMMEMESLIAGLFPEHHVCRMPIEDFDATSVNINAPTRHEWFSPHFDSNPLFADPNSMFHGIFGSYNNRTANRPIFCSVLLYLVKEWHDEWGAPTSFAKFKRDMFTPEAKKGHHYVKAKPGRVVVMHSDIWHSVHPPTDLAGERPRYSIVWRLILYPKNPSQDMRESFKGGRNWPDAKEVWK